MAKTYNSMKEVLQCTNNGKMTVALKNERDVDNLRKKYFSIYSKLNVCSLKPPKGAPITFIQAKDIETYMSLIENIERYELLGERGQLLPPAQAI